MGSQPEFGTGWLIPAIHKGSMDESASETRRKKYLTKHGIKKQPNMLKAEGSISNYISIKANWKNMESAIAFGLKFVPSVGSIKLLFGQDAVSASVFTILESI